MPKNGRRDSDSAMETDVPSKKTRKNPIKLTDSDKNVIDTVQIANNCVTARIILTSSPDGLDIPSGFTVLTAKNATTGLPMTDTVTRWIKALIHPTTGLEGFKNTSPDWSTEIYHVIPNDIFETQMEGQPGTNTLEGYLNSLAFVASTKTLMTDDQYLLRGFYEHHLSDCGSLEGGVRLHFTDIRARRGDIILVAGVFYCSETKWNKSVKYLTFSYIDGDDIDQDALQDCSILRKAAPVLMQDEESAVLDLDMAFRKKKPYHAFCKCPMTKDMLREGLTVNENQFLHMERIMPRRYIEELSANQYAVIDYTCLRDSEKIIHHLKQKDKHRLNNYPVVFEWEDEVDEIYIDYVEKLMRCRVTLDDFLKTVKHRKPRVDDAKLIDHPHALDLAAHPLVVGCIGKVAGTFHGLYLRSAVLMSQKKGDLFNKTYLIASE